MNNLVLTSKSLQSDSVRYLIPRMIEPDISGLKAPPPSPRNCPQKRIYEPEISPVSQKVIPVLPPAPRICPQMPILTPFALSLSPCSSSSASKFGSRNHISMFKPKALTTRKFLSSRTVLSYLKPDVCTSHGSLDTKGREVKVDGPSKQTGLGVKEIDTGLLMGNGIQIDGKCTQEMEIEDAPARGSDSSVLSVSIQEPEHEIDVISHQDSIGFQNDTVSEVCLSNKPLDLKEPPKVTISSQNISKVARKSSTSSSSNLYQVADPKGIYVEELFPKACNYPCTPAPSFSPTAPNRVASCVNNSQGMMKQHDSCVLSDNTKNYPCTPAPSFSPTAPNRVASCVNNSQGMMKQHDSCVLSDNTKKFTFSTRTLSSPAPSATLEKETVVWDFSTQAAPNTPQNTPCSISSEVLSPSQVPGHNLQASILNSLMTFRSTSSSHLELPCVAYPLSHFTPLCSPAPSPLARNRHVLAAN